MNDVLDLPFIRYVLVLLATLIGLRIWLNRSEAIRGRLGERPGSEPAGR